MPPVTVPALASLNCSVVVVSTVRSGVAAVGTVEEVMGEPRHPYTGGLLASVPRLDAPRGAPLHPIPGSPTDLLPWSEGCAFAPRCPNRVEPCTGSPPALESAGGRELRCYNPLAAAEEVPA